MPKRIVDGEGIWNSDKILALKDEYQGEYANLVPLAEANGVFEADYYKVWSRVYSYNRRTVAPEWVKGLLEDLIRVGMLLTWTDKGKVWGFWEGNQKPGRLPKESEKEKYKNLPPDPPQSLFENKTRQEGEVLSEVSAEFPLNLPPRYGTECIGQDGSGPESATQQNPSLENNDGQENDVKLKDELTKIAAYHGAKAGGFKTTWDKIKTLGVSHGTGAVATDFAAYMEEFHGDDFPSGAVVSYLDHAEDRLTADSAPAAVVSKDPRIAEITGEIAYLSGDKVIFHGKHLVQLAGLLEDHTVPELLSVFKTFVETKDLEDSYTLKFIAQNYLDGARSLAYSARKRKQEQDKTQAAREAKATQMREEAEAERKKAESERAEVESFDPLADLG